MAIGKAPDIAGNGIEKGELKQSIERINEQMGLSRDPSATAEQAQDLMTREGVRREDRILSSELERMRYQNSRS